MMKRHDPIEFTTRDGKSVTIREMDESFVFGGDMKTNPHTNQPGCCTADCPIDPKTAKPNHVFQAFHREAMRRYGQSMILAWHEELVVGFINFHPLNASFDVLCPHDDSTDNRKRFDEFGWPEHASATLRIVCVDLSSGFRRTGLGTRLVEVLIQWAPAWGFSRLHVGANEKSWWIPCRPFWDRLGFEVVKTIEFDEPNPAGDTKVFVMERDV